MGIQQQKLLNVLIIGDSCLDVYHYGTCDRLSPEAPVPVLKLSHTERKNGMALNVKSNLESFNVHVDIFTNHQTITKERYVDIKTKNHLLRFDTGEACKLKPFTIKDADRIEYSEYDAIAIVDYNKGFIDHSVAMCISKKCSDYKIPLFVDSKKIDLSCFYNGIIKINDLECSNVKTYPSKYELIVTHGSKGAEYKKVLYPTSPVEVHDVCGAGDTFFASLIYKYLSRENLVKAIKFANKCARITVTKEGTYSLNKKDVKSVSR